METLNDLGSSPQCDVPLGASAKTSSHSSLDPLAHTTTSVATPCLVPSATTSSSTAVGGGMKCPMTSSAAGGANNPSLSTSSLSVHTTGVVTSGATATASASIMPAATKIGKKDKQSVTDVICSTPSASLSSSAEQSPSATDSDLTGENPHKLLQAVRSTTLPFPLPVPTYSQAVQAARASGNVLTERATIIRETVKYFLNHKYWWTSEDYDRIAELVVNEFPELRDPIVWPTTPCYSKVRLDLSMCARNIRRIAKNQEKRRGSPRHHSTESAEPAAEPAVKPRKGTGKGGRRGSAQVSMSSPTMVTLQPTGQMLPHTAHTAHTTVPTTSTTHDHKEAAGLPFMLTSTAPTSSSSTVLPPVAHFLGHPSAHSHSPGGIVFPSLLPATLSLTTDASNVALSTSVASPSGSHQVGEGSMAVPELVARHDGFMDNAASLAAAWRPDAQLPDPLPVPPYSDKVMKAKEKGVTKYERPLIIRETVLFFLSLKYWWSSVDYDRISDFVVDYFPDLKDPLLSPNMPPNRRVRTDLSQTARNIRRREVMLRRRDSRSPEDRFAAVGTVTMPPHSVQQPSTDFCNELLAAASIIESRTAALHQKDVAKALELHAEVSREMDGSTGVITHTQTVKNAEPSRPPVGNGKGLSDSASVSKEQMSEAAKYPYNYTSVNEVMNQGLEPSEGAVLNSQLAVVKQEVGEEESQLDQYQVLQAQAQASQAWFSAQMSQALSMQALTGLSAQMSQALSVAQISEQLMSSQGPPHSTSTQSSTPPAAHQSGSGSGGGGCTPSQGQATVSLQQLSQVGGYNLPTSTALSDNNSLADSSHVDRMSAMAMWRSTCLPDPLPNPPYSLNVLRARDSGNTASARPRIIRETTQFFLSMKMWWTTQDYERIAELVLRQFPALKTVQNIKKDLGTCARNMRRRLPLSRNKQWAGYQSPPHSVLKEGDGIGEGGGLTLGELATMASLREAQDKGRTEAASLASLSEEQRQTLLAHSVYEQNTLAWSALYQQQFSSPAETTAVLPQAHSHKRSLSDSTGSKGIEVADRELAEALKQAALEQSVKQFGDTDSSRHHSVDVNEGVQSKEMKREHAGKGSHRSDSSEVSKSESHPMIKELMSHSSLPSREHKLSTESASCHAGQVPHKPALTEGLVHAHQTPVRAHSQPGAQVRPEINSMEEEVPMNLTCTSCSSEVSKEHKPEKYIKSEPKGSKNSSSGVETFSAREQVWFPHGSPWKKSGQNVFKALPTPLPVPRYSHKLIKAHEEGLAYRHRSEIIRETARFFLGFKYWWSSADYSRISELVVLQFPELKDPVTHPGQPYYRRVQRDLSMCARNLRRKNTRRQQLSVGEANPPTSPKKAKSGGSKDRKPRKDGDLKRESAPANSTVKQMATKQQSEPPQAALAATTSTSLAHTMFEAVSDHCSLPIMSSTPILTSHASKQAADNVKLTGHVVGSVQTTGTPSFPNLSSSISSTALAASSSTGQHKQSENNSELVGLNRESSVMEASLLEKAADKKESGVPHSNNKALPTSINTKNVKSVVPSAHRSQGYTEGQSTGKAIPKSSSGAGHKVGSTRTNKDLGRHSQLASRSSLAEARALSNTTAIVTPTLSEAHTTESRNAEGGVSDKVYINPEHGSELQIQLTKLWQEGKFFDASLEVDDYRLPVHKLVLLAASPYLQSTFRHANPTSHLEVNLPRDTGVGAARDFLKYIYQGVLHVAPETVNALRRIAAMLQIDQLLTYCDDYICRLTGTTAANLPHHSTLSHSSPQVPRVSVNLRDPDHAHSLTTDQNSIGVTGQSLEFSDGRSSMPMGGVQYLQEDPSSSRKRNAMSPVAGQSYQDHYSVQTVDDREKAHIVQALPCQSGRQEELQTGMVFAKRLRPSSKITSEEQEVATVVLEPQAGMNYHDVVDDQQLQLEQDHLSTLQHSALVQHLTSDKVSSRAQSSVIQRGPNATQMLSHSKPASSNNFGDHEAVVHFLPQSEDSRQLSDDAQSQLTEENVTVTLLPQTDVEVEVREEMQVEPAHTLQHLSEEGQVVEEVVVDTGDLLQDVEVAACETVECSLLPQTYCSSPEDSQALPSHTDTALQSMASQWAAQQYAEAPLDAATAQQFVTVLQERLYGHSSSPSTQDQQSQEASYEQQQEVYMQQCTDASTIYVTTQPQSAVHELVVETSAMANSPCQPSQQTSEDSQASLLPQTYCSSPQSYSPPVSTH